ncbi:MAG: LON peptidase substrate-binding domain-containing protein [Deltaproteobacteria bacterium]|jgi:Lon protease-like protein
MRDMLAPPDPDTLSSLPMFPLPNCVLLPGGLLPLHVFEPRYRDLTRDCLAGNHYMGIARLRPGYETTYYGKPPVYERFGVGKIICSEELPDGRFALLLRGVARVEIARELPTEHAYRRVEARMLADADHDRDEAFDHHRRLIMLCDRLAEVIDAGGPQLRDLARSFDDPGMCADAIAAALVMDCDARQELLEAIDPIARVQRTLGYVSHMLCELAPCPEAVN